ncbi:MAG TPA: hypothetical protein VIG24_00290 [Acidimicrobiia bacterium]
MPSIAVIATWLLLAVWLLLLGSPAGVLAGRRFGRLTAFRLALWFGLAAALLLLLLVNFIVPLRSSAAVTIAIAAAVIAALIAVGLFVFFRARNQAPNPPPQGRFGWWSLILIAFLALSLIAVAHASFGAANQWDAGLYHLNAIQYASEYRVIPGLANVHDRFGVTNSQHLLTALLSNSGWGVDAFRLQVGFFVFLFSTDLTLRVLDTRKTSRSVGTIVLLLSAFGVIPFLLSNPDELITSPSPDSVTLLITLVGAAYLADGLSARRTELAATGIVIVATAASVRTQMWAFAVIAAVVVFVYFRRGKSGRHRPKALTLVAGTISAGLLIATQVRDALQSGWLLFPLDLLPLPVDWKAFDPAASRLWIVSWARTPGAAPEEVMDTWSWLGGWVTRALDDGAVRLMLGLLAVAATLWLIHARRSSPAHQPSRGATAALALMVPVLVAVALWFLSAPDPRFAWGPIILVGAIPAAVVVMQRLGSLAAPVAAAVAALAIAPAAISSLAAINGASEESEAVVTFFDVPWTVSAALTPVPRPELAVYTLPTGQELITPTSDDRCWTAFPLCRPYPNDALIFRGDSVQDGFASRLWNE